jgi:chromosome segregation ATPase
MVLKWHAARAEPVRVAVAYAQEAVVARERVEASIKEAKARATLAKREAQKRVLKMETESVTSLAFVHREADEFSQNIVLLKGELADAR